MVTGASFGGEYGIAGTLNNLSGGVFDIEGDAGISGFDAPVVSGPPATITNAGTLVKSAGTGTSTVIATDFTNSGNIEVDTGTLAIGGGGSTLSNQGGSFTGGYRRILQLVATGNYDGNSALTVNGLFSGSGGGTVQLNGDGQGNGQLVAGSGGATLDFPNLQWTGGDLSGNLTNSGNMTVAPVAGYDLVLDDGTLTNSGTIRHAAGTWYLGLAQPDQRPRRSLRLPKATGRKLVPLRISAMARSPVFNNLGMVTKSAGTGVSAIGVTTFNNSGTVEVDAGTLDLPPGGTSTGGNFLVDGGTLSTPETIEGGSISLSNGGALLNSGTVTGVSLNVVGNSTLQGNGTLSDVTIPAGSEVDLTENSTQTFSGTLTDDGVLDVQSGTTKLSTGPLEVDGSGVLVVSPIASLTVGGNLVGNSQNADALAPQGSVLLNGSGTSAAPQLSKSSARISGIPRRVFKTTSLMARWRSAKAPTSSSLTMQ